MISKRGVAFAGLLTAEFALVLFFIGRLLSGRQELVGIVQAITGVLALVATILLLFIDVRRKHTPEAIIKVIESNRRVQVGIAVSAVVLLVLAVWPIFPLGPHRYVVYANLGWQNTGIHVERGQIVTITATDGQWKVGPNNTPTDANGYDVTYNTDLFAPDSHYGSLVGMIGTGNPFALGTTREFRAETTGELLLRISDLVTEDNEGTVNVQIVIQNG